MSLRRHTLLNLMGALAPMVVGLLTVPAYLRLIGPDRYGALAVLWALLGYFSFLDLGLGRAVAQRLARHSAAPEEERSRLVWTAIIATLALSAIGVGLLWASSEWLITHFFDVSPSRRTEAKTGAGWLLVLLPIALVGSVLQGALQARFQFLTLNLAQTLGITLSQLLPLLAAMTGRVGLDSLIPAVVLARLCTLGILIVQSGRHVPIRGRPLVDVGHLKELIAYGGWISITSMLGPLLVTIDRLVIASVAGTRAVAFYTVPYDLAIKAMVLTGSVANALNPRLASSSAGDARSLAARVTTLLVAAMTPMIALAILLGKPTLDLWLGRGVAAPSSYVAEIILTGVWLHAVVTPHHSRLLAHDTPKKVVLVYLAEMPVYFAMLFLGLRSFGVAGAATAWSLRVAMDVVLLLRVADVLAEVVRTIWLSGLVILAELATSLLLREQVVARYTLGLLLVATAVLLNRGPLEETWGRLKGGRALPRTV